MGRPEMVKHSEAFTKRDIIAPKSTNLMQDARSLTSDGRFHLLDLIVFATGFDASEGAFNVIDFLGQGGVSLREHWKPHPEVNLGTATNNFPNLFLINGPGVPFANNPPVCEAGGNFVLELISRADQVRQNGDKSGVAESEANADHDWAETCGNVAKMTLFAETPSWFFGENIEGKNVFLRFWFGGIAKWREAINQSRENDWLGFNFDA